MRRTTIAVGLALGCALLGTPGQAHAVWGDPQLVSVHEQRLEQADGASGAVDVSGDGRWVVFHSRATNFFADDDADAPGTMRRGGVFRFDRLTGAIDLVADGDLIGEEDGALLLRGATAPSVSDDGRRVAFATAQRLAPQDDNDNVDVYVRDMAVPLAADRAASGAYVLVSARDGSDAPARYAAPDPPPPGGLPGAAVHAAHAISADGRHVAFRTTEVASDLPARDQLDTPAGSVFVRDLEARTTTLVNPLLDGSGAAGGALAPVVLSRDGSTVAWVGENGPAQTRMLNGEGADASQRYYLWRRWADPGATTRRVTGFADPDDPGCTPEQRIVFSPTATGPCYGPLTDAEGVGGDIGSRAPALSADGWTVAFVVGAGRRPSVADDAFLDVFVTSMRPGETRKGATREVTRGTTSSNARANGNVESVALSADGRRLALVTSRREFLPPAPPLLSPARPSPPIASELYVLDLDGADGGAIRRPLTPGGGEIGGTIEPDPALSADGRTIAFTTRAANLVAGDANELTDVFAVTERDDPPVGGPPAGAGQDDVDLDVGSDDEAAFGARASTRRDGTVLVRVSVPAAGGVKLVARTRPARASARRARGGSGSGRGGGASARARQVAAASVRARRRGTVRAVLRLRGADRRAVRRGRALPVRLTVTLRPSAGGRARTTTLSARFRFTPARRAARGPRSAK